ncbi:MAG: hypothetical protein R2822_25840 [Spirosomataceae bacterium]
MSSAFSSAAPKQRFVGDGGESKVVDIPSQTRYVSYLGISVPVIEKVTVPSGSIQDFGYFDQISSNRNLVIAQFTCSDFPMATKLATVLLTHKFSGKT